jgi:hypothetical protein
MSEIKRIFVSHKASNGKIVSDMLDILKSGMAGVEFFLSEQIEPGDNWRSDVVKEIKSADCLLLLYLDPDQDWSWCMFEAGLFSAYKPKNGERRLYCIQYPGSSPPDPLSEIQTTSAIRRDENIPEELLFHDQADRPQDMGRSRCNGIPSRGLSAAT